jgi:hypothetical protein
MKGLEDRITKIEKTIEILKYTVKDLLIQINQDRNTNSHSSTKLVKKDRVLIQSLLERSKEEFHTKFLSNILSSSYDTLTPKQYKVLVDIQNNI